MTNLHDLIRRMADELDHYRQLRCDDRTDRHALATEARAALAEVQAQGQAYQAGRRDAEADAQQAADAAQEPPADDGPAVPQGREPASVELQATAGELVASIRHFLSGYKQIRGLDPENIYSIHRGHAMEGHITVSVLTRAADLLEHLALQPLTSLTTEHHD